MTATNTKFYASETQLNKLQKFIALLLVLIIALLPVGRLSELPIIVMMFWGAGLLVLRFKKLLAQDAFKPFSWVFFCYFLLVLISALDSFWSDKSYLVALASWRFYLMGLVIFYFANLAFIQLVIKWISWLMVFWAIDAILQYAFGYNLFGMNSYDGRLTGVFGQNVKLGPVLALFLPLVLVQTINYPAIMRWLVVGLIVAVILLSGTRSAWLMTGFILIMYGWHHVQGRRWWLLLKSSVITICAVLILWFISSDFQQRIERSVAVFHGNEQAVDFALADRLPIWRTAINMYQAHPFNGIGARAFRHAYVEFAEPGDVWVEQNGGGLHAHHWVLEVMAETGTVGMLLMLMLIGIIVKYISKQFQYNSVWPFAIALLAALLPIISLYSLFSSFWSICLWTMLILLFTGVNTNNNQL